MYSLNDAMSGAAEMGMDREIQLVFFHPKFQFRDGQARTSMDSSAPNFARRYYNALNLSCSFGP